MKPSRKLSARRTWPEPTFEFSISFDSLAQRFHPPDLFCSYSAKSRAIVFCIFTRRHRKFPHQRHKPFLNLINRFRPFSIHRDPCQSKRRVQLIDCTKRLDLCIAFTSLPSKKKIGCPIIAAFCCDTH